MSIQDALAKLEQARGTERGSDPWSPLPETNARRYRERQEKAMALRMEAVVLAIAAQLEAQDQ